MVEGYTDVIAMHLAGVETAVATCGTALGDEHFDLLRRFSERVVLAFDSDEAGTKAALRSDELESPFRLDLDVRVAVMPDGLDPADLVQEDRGKELASVVASARPLLEHRIEHEVSKYDLKGPEGRARALHAAAQQVRRVNDEIARREYTRFVARLVGVDLDTAERAVRSSARPSRAQEGVLAEPLDRAEGELMRVILANPHDRGDVAAEDFTDARLHHAFEAMASQIASTGPGTPIDISGIDDPDARAVLRSLALDDRPLPTWADVELLVKGRRLDLEIDDMELTLTKLEEGTEPHSDAFRRLIALQQEKRSLSES